MTNFLSQIKIKTAVVLSCCLLFLPPALAFDRRTPVVQAVQKVGPAVVNVSSEQEVAARSNPFGNNPFFDNFFRDFFERQPQKRVSLGSGVIIDGQRGYILTNAHVIESRATIKVVLMDERQFDARIVGADPDSDLAVLQIKSDKPLPAVEMGDSEDLMIGETVIAIGNPFGFSHSVTTGVISAVHRSVKTDQRVYHEFIQTDASINPGNSGGPLLNINGELIGINTAIYAKAQGIGFAIPIDNAKKIISDLIQFGQVQQAWIGLLVQDLDTHMANYLNLEKAEGALVAQVEDESPAAAQGLAAGDLITMLDRHKIGNSSEYFAAARAVPAGETAHIGFVRDGRAHTADIRTKIFPKERAPELAWRRLGVKIAEITPALRARYHLSARQGVVITDLRSETYLSRIGAAPGDVILQMANQSIAGREDFYNAMIEYRQKGNLLLLLQREGQVYYLTVQMAP